MAGDSALEENVVGKALLKTVAFGARMDGDELAGQEPKAVATFSMRPLGAEAVAVPDNTNPVELSASV